MQPNINTFISNNTTFTNQFRAKIWRFTEISTGWETGETRVTFSQAVSIAGNEERYFPGLTHPDRPLECSASPVHRWRILAYKTQPSEKEGQSEEELAVGVSEWPSQSLSNCVIQWNDGICCVWRCLVKPTDRSRRMTATSPGGVQGQDLRNI